jgi:hypothetical protein
MRQLARHGRDYWTRLVDQFNKSGNGQSQKVFAAANGVKLGTFQRWLYLLRRERTKTERGSQAKFIEIKAERRSGQPVRMRVGQAVIDFDRLPDTDWVAELIYSYEQRLEC